MTDFTCQVDDERYLSACKDLPEYQDTGYCVLHLPSKPRDSEAKFQEALERKYEKRDYNFQGVHFPNYFKGWERERFPSGTTFYGATFEGDTFFDLSTFEGGADFNGATFNGIGHFSRTTFNGYADFRYAIFNEKAWFPGSTFEAIAWFHGATFEGAINFSGAVFAQEVDFSLVEFRDAALFVEAKTNPQAPLVLRYATAANPERISFRGMYLRPHYFIDVDPQKFDFYEVEWFRLSNGDELTLEAEIEAVGREARLERNQSLRKLQKACRRLTSNAEENRDYPTANKFHHWSMEALRKEGWARLGLIGTLYWALSGYGVRAARAAWVLVAMWAAFTVFYMLVDPSEFKDFGQGISFLWQAAVYSLLALARLNPEPRPEEPGLFQFLVGLEGILGPLQIALLALAIRRQVMR